MGSALGSLQKWIWLLALGGFALVVVAPLGYRTGVLPLGIAFLVLLGGVLLSWWVLLLSLAKLRPRESRTAGWLRVVLPLGLAAGAGIGPVVHVFSALGLPAIHDITTDTVDPPRFAVLVTERGAEANSLEYGGAAVAAAQRTAYPALGPLTVDRSPDKILGFARDTAEAMGWEVVAVDPEAGRLEAIDTTFWFGFRDDVVVRVRPGTDGVRVDVRSVSRVGVGDLGANAARIRHFLGLLAVEALNMPE